MGVGGGRGEDGPGSKNATNFAASDEGEKKGKDCMRRINEREIFWREAVAARAARESQRTTREWGERDLAEWLESTEKLKPALFTVVL